MVQAIINILRSVKICSCFVPRIQPTRCLRPENPDSLSLSLISCDLFAPTTFPGTVFQRHLANMHICTALLATLLAAEGHAANSNTRREDTSSVWNTTSCATSDLQIIKEWRNLTSSEKSAYIAAEKCLWELPANTSFDGVVNRHDDLTAVHQYLTPVIHAVVSPPIA